MSFTIKSFDDILADMVTWIIANSPTITDLTPGSVIRSFCEGSALGMEELYVATYLGFKRYLANVPETVFDFPRKVGTKATVKVVFSRAVAGAEVPIPIGTRVKTPTGLRFILDAATTIPNAVVDSPSVQVTADEVGTSYNVSLNTVTVLEDQITGVDTVTNALAAVGGVNREPDISYNNRFQAYIEGLGKSNLAGLKSGVLSVEGITSVSIIELFPPIADVNVEVYIDDGSAAGVSTAKVTEVQGVVDGDGTEDSPGYRAAGINVEVKKPGITTVPITATLSILAGVDTDQLQSDVIDALTAYVNTLPVGDDVVYHELISSIMGVYGVSDVVFTDPTANVAISASNVGRLGAVSLLGV